MLLLYHESFEGFLSAVFDAFKIKEGCTLAPLSRYPGSSLYEVREVLEDQEKYERVWAGMRRLGPETAPTVYRAWLSEIADIEDDILASLRLGFERGKDPFVLRQVAPVRRVCLAAQRTGKEAHDYLGFVRFIRADENLFVADIAPGANVLPLIGNHFHMRFGDQNLIIRDTVRRTAILSTPQKWELIVLPKDQPLPPLPAEGSFEELWRSYFKTISNPDRMNLNLQRNFVPKKRRAYLTEFQ